MNWKDVYSSRRRYLGTVGKWYLLSLVILILTYIPFDQFRKTGKIIVRRVIFSGNEAMCYIGATFLVCVMAIIYASFIGIYGLRYFKTDNRTKENLTPENWICEKCQNTFPGYSVTSSKCPQCDGNLEDLDGFYDRNPHIKYKNTKDN